MRDCGTAGVCCQCWGLTLREWALLTGERGIQYRNVTPNKCLVYVYSDVGFDPSVKKMASCLLSVVKILFSVKHQGHQPNLNSPPVFPWPPHFQAVIVSPSFLHRKLKVHKNYYLCQKLPVFFNACGRYYKNVQGLLRVEHWNHKQDLHWKLIPRVCCPFFFRILT